MRHALVDLVCAALLAAAAPSLAAQDSADERILAFHSEMTVQADGGLVVTEMITVRAAGQQIRRGICRDFPVRYAGRDRRRVIVPFEVVDVQRDGRPEAYHTESNDPYVRIYLGRKDVHLKPGVYTYRLTYRVGRMLGFFRDHDELYFNVTGNEWTFPIDVASATVALPEGVPAAKMGHEAYTGPKGAKGKDYESSVDAAGRACFRTTRPLAAGEELTIVVTWPKGFVAAPTLAEEWRYLLADNAMVLAGLIGLGVVLVYYLAAWAYVGRDPPKGLVIPLFEPPEGLCPASVRYLVRMGFDKVCFTATVIGLAVRRCLTIEEEKDGEYRLVRQPEAGRGDLGPVEQKVFERLLGSRADIRLKNANHQTFSGAIEDEEKALAQTFQGRYFHSNLGWFVPGVVLSVLTLAAVALLAALIEGNPTVAFLCVWLSFWTLGVVALARMVVNAWRSVRRGTGRLVKSGGAVFLTLFAVPFFAAEIGVSVALVYMTSVWLLPILVLLALANSRFRHFLKRPTVDGRRLMDQIEGFRMYLGTAERDLLFDAGSPPHQTPDLFEKYLPYAVALGVENAWAAKFEDVLQRAAAAPGGYSPTWYHGSSWRTMGTAGFASSLGGSFSSALGSASTAPGSSSGSGGGGSSGGGGGGGGGSGW